MSELFWAALKVTLQKQSENWIVGGDFNTSEYLGSTKLQRDANLQAINRLEELGLKETVRLYNNGSVPTWRPIRKDQVLKHQQDHLYVSEELIPRMNKAVVVPSAEIITPNLSHHLPIITDFNL